MKETTKYKKIPELGGLMAQMRFIDWLAEAFFNSIMNDEKTDTDDAYVAAAAGLVKNIQAFSRSLDCAYYDLCVAQAKKEQESKAKKEVKK